MCGRTACTLAPGVVRQACSYRDKTSGRYRQPEWRSSGREYKPSHNMCPTDVTPVLVSGVTSEEPRALVPMVWGLIPAWHKGGSKGHGLTTHNCRSEGIKTSKLYEPSLSTGRRCVIVCDGFYEWQTTKGDKNKQPYFIYMKQPEGVSIVDHSKDSWCEENGWIGRTLLYIAGIYNTTHSPEGEELYSYSMVTMESGPEFAWLHHRIPAILESDQMIEDWLDSKRVPPTEALAALKPVSCLVWHKVAPLVNNCRYKEAQCNKPLSESRAANPLMKWLQKSPASKRPVVVKNKEELAECAERSTKKIKTETDKDNKTEVDEDNKAETDKDNKTEVDEDNKTEVDKDNKTEVDKDNKTETDKDNKTESDKDNKTESDKEIKTESDKEFKTETS